MRALKWVLMAGVLLAVLVAEGAVSAEEPQNPFGIGRPQRNDAVAGRIELSNGKVVNGRIYLTRGRNLRIYDAEKERFRDVPLRVVREIDCLVEKEWDEKEWRFKENANDEKIFTGRTYPARIYVHELKLIRGDRITGKLAALVHVTPSDADGENKQPAKPQKFLLHKRDKGEPGTTLKDLVYVTRIVLAPKE